MNSRPQDSLARAVFDTTYEVVMLQAKLACCERQSVAFLQQMFFQQVPSHVRGLERLTSVSGLFHLLSVPPVGAVCWCSLLCVPLAVCSVLAQDS